jgi:hypothetical protein
MVLEVSVGVWQEARRRNKNPENHNRAGPPALSATADERSLARFVNKDVRYLSKVILKFKNLRFYAK